MANFVPCVAKVALDEIAASEAAPAVPAADAGAESSAAGASASAPQRGNKRKRGSAMPTMHKRMSIWHKFGPAQYKHLTPVALRLLCCHATSCATEREILDSVGQGLPGIP
jgi:hypothetical protein